MVNNIKEEISRRDILEKEITLIRKKKKMHIRSIFKLEENLLIIGEMIGIIRGIVMRDNMIK